MDLLQQIVARAKADKQRIVLPEAEEERTLKAADKVLADDLADIILIGNPANIKNLAAQWGLNNIDKATIVDPQNNPKTEEYAEKLAELRKKKGMTVEQARELVTKNNLYLGCMIIKTEGADGQISGALSTTGDTLRPALQIIKCTPGITCVSGAMLLISDQKQYGQDGIVVMGDVAVTPNPTADQLAQIAYTTAHTAQSVAGITDPQIAMLSFSTKGSAKDAINKETGKSVYIIDKVKDAVAIAKEKFPELHLDGELQADAALVPEVAAKKAPKSEVAGKANVLVVPNLEVGNIGYKLVQRLGGAIAIGPILQGIARPVNDLSRALDKIGTRPDLGSSLAIYNYMLPKMQDLDTEEAWLLMMNQNFKLIKASCISKGGITETATDIRLIIKEAVLNNATIIAFCHNHPSNNPQPSKADDVLTQKIAKACEIMRLFFMDHVIITDGAFYSYHDKGKL
jgi:phosphate acetyltransferase